MAKTEHRVLGLDLEEAMTRTDELFTVALTQARKEGNLSPALVGNMQTIWQHVSVAVATMVFINNQQLTEDLIDLGVLPADETRG